MPTYSKKIQKEQKIAYRLKRGQRAYQCKKVSKEKKMYEIRELIHFESRAQSEGSRLKPNALSQLVGSH